MNRDPSLQGVGALRDPPSALVSALEAIVGIEGVSTDPSHREEAGADMWSKALLWKRQGLLPIPPDVVVFPKNAEELAKIMEFASERGIPVVPVGARSGVCGGVIPLETGSLAIDARRLSRLGPADPERLEVSAGAGILGDELERSLGSQGFTLGHYPASIGCSSVGGWLATRSGGQSSSRYGKIEDMVISLECVLGTGEIVRPSRPAAGLDWIELFAGSEGTLGFITEATFRIWPTPEEQIPSAWRFPNLAAGLGAMREILQRGDRPSVMRLYDPFDSAVALRGKGGVQEASPPPKRGELLPGGTRPAPLRTLWDLALGNPFGLNLLARVPRACLLLLVHEGESWEVATQAQEAREICEGFGGQDRGEGPARRWMAKRWEVSRNLPTVFELGGWVDTMEVAIGWGGVERLHKRIRQAVSPFAFVMAHFSHAYPDGCSIYFTFVGAAEDVDKGIERYERAWEAALGAAKREGATLTHHHGLGLLKAPWLEGEVGAKGIDVLRALKRVCDPEGILNPGKLAG